MRPVVANYIDELPAVEAGKAGLAARACRALLLALALPWFTASAVAQEETGGRFAIRADTARSAEIARVLEQIALPDSIPVESASAGQDLLQSVCKGRMPTTWQVQQTDTGLTVAFTPCLRQKGAARIEVREGDTLEQIARRYGLHPGAASSLKVDGAAPSPGAMVRPGQVVTIPSVPEWTPFVTKSRWNTRTEVARELARGLGCGNEPVESCLLRLAVILVDRDPEPAYPRLLDTVSINSFFTLDGLFPRLPIEAFADFASLDPSTAARSGVATGQWPYDVGRIAKILSSAEVQQAVRERAVVGIADNGLGDKKGAPLPEDAFVEFDWEGEDGNFNDIVGDRIGAGVARSDEVTPDGDVSLCSAMPPPVFSDWRTLNEASHGAIVASLAFGMDLFSAPGSSSSALPQIAFYRMVSDACSEDANLAPRDQMVMLQAFEYLTRQWDLVSISYVISGANASVFAGAARPVLENDWKLLFVPAGNHGDDLNEDAPCPACLANPVAFANAARRVIVVGAATPALRVADYSGRGSSIVRLFAPAESAGGLAIDGQSATGAGQSTSFAAPRAALAAAIMQALGVRKNMDIKHRLMLASWPLLTETGAPSPEGERVLDLTKAAAVLHYAVEARVDEGGKTVRKTYVGDLVGRLEDLEICSSGPFSPQRYQALEFREAVDGVQAVDAFTRRVDLSTDRLAKKRFSGCRPAGKLVLTDIVEGQVEIPLTTVTQILMPWKPPPAP